MALPKFYQENIFKKYAELTSKSSNLNNANNNNTNKKMCAPCFRNQIVFEILNFID